MLTPLILSIPLIAYFGYCLFRLVEWVWIAPLRHVNALRYVFYHGKMQQVTGITAVYVVAIMGWYVFWIVLT